MGGHPRKIGAYRILEPLGRGGMGIVYRAEHAETGRQVALKTVLVPDETLLQSIRREIHALARLQHPGIVPILEEGLEEGVPWYAMELLEGVTLRRFASYATQGPTATDEPVASSSAWWTASVQDKQVASSALERLGPPEGRGRAGRGGLEVVLGLVRRLCSPLAFLHGEGVVHRDLKPDNVFVRPDGRPVLMDFGIVSRFGGELSREELEVGGKLFGTVAYMAPEQGRGEFVDARADLYSLGCILYELVTGRPPFVGESLLHVLRQHFKAEPVPPSRLAADMPAGLEALILQLLAKEPHKRLGHAGAVAEALGRLGAPGDAPAEEPPAKAYLYRPRFVGREQPLAELMERLEQTGARRGGLVLIGGESGVGKTRLAMELASAAHRREVRVLTGECVPGAASGERRAASEEQTSSSGLAALPESARAPSLRSDRSPSLAAAAGPLHALRRPLQAVADRCRELGPTETERLLGGRAATLARYEPALRALPGLEALPEPEELSTDAAPLRVFHALCETFAALAEARPLLLVLDDLQWADELTLGFVGFLVQGGHLEGKAWLLVGTYRSEEAGARGWLEPLEAGAALRLRLGRLEQGAVRSLVGDMLALPEPDERFVQALARHAEGNAFFIAEYLRTAVAEGLLFRDRAGRWRLAEQDEAQGQAGGYQVLPLPRSIHELVGRRLQGLPLEARGLAEAAAVLGRETDGGLVQAVSALADEPYFEALDELFRRQVLEASGPERVRFLHDQLREVALEGIAAERLRGLHRVAATSIETRGGAEEKAAGLAHHWERAGEELRAAHFWTEAGHQALTAYAVEEAGTTLDHAVGLLGAEPPAESRKDLIRALDARSRLRDHLGRFAEAASDASQMAGLAQAAADRLGLGRALRQQGVTLYNGGDYKAALERYREALAVLEDVGEPEEICETRHLIAWIHSSRGEYEAAMKFFAAALQTPGLTADTPAQLNAKMQLALTLNRCGQLREAITSFTELLALHDRRGDTVNQARCKSAIGLIQRELGDWEQASSFLEAAKDVFRRVHALQDFLVCSNNLGLVLIDRGQFARAEPIFLEMRNAAERSGEIELAGIATVQLSYCRLCRADLPAALELARQATQSFERLGNWPWLRESLLRQGDAYAATAVATSSDECFRRALEMSRSVNTPLYRWKVSMSWALARFERGDPGETTHPLVEEAALAAAELQQSEPGQLVKALRALGGVRNSLDESSEQRWGHFHESVSCIREGSRFRSILQRLLLIGAEVSLRQDKMDQAKKLLTKYRFVADLENLLFESRASQIESLLGRDDR
jgi:serine/threonine protein kinase/tetratricopeptide (TPR) repeat protein